MKSQKKVRLSKFSEGFEIGKTGQSTIFGGATKAGGSAGAGRGGDQITYYYLLNNEACSMSCQDSKVDVYAN
jgi:hypothetical protein